MAEARHRARLSPWLPPRAGVAAARVGMAASLVALVALGIRDLRLSGFRFRWQTEPPTAAAPPGSAGRVARRVETRPAGQPATPQAGGNAGAPAEAVAGGDPSPETGAGSEGGSAVTPLEPPGLGDGELPPAGTGRRVVIDFESFGDGTPMCAPCRVSDEWASAGLLLSFRSWTATSDAPYLLDGRDYLPPDAARHAIGPAFRPDRGLEVGVVRLDFLDRPRLVEMTIYGPDIVPRFEITAWTGDRVLTGAVTQDRVRTYDIQGRGRFREERVTVRADAGIDRVSLDGWGPPGHMVLVDDLVITP